MATWAPEFVRDDGGRRAAGFKGETGDCVTRAIAIACGKPYAEVYQALDSVRDGMRQTRRVRKSSARTGVIKQVYETYLHSLGWTWVPCMSIGSGCKVHLRADELPMGRIICRLSGHLATMIDGVLHDTSDCSRQGMRCVYGYWITAGELGLCGCVGGSPAEDALIESLKAAREGREPDN